MATPVIETTNLTKSYGGRPVVRDFSFTVNPGEVYALVGPNGAGKTTVIRLVSGLAFPSSGSVRIMGQNPHQVPAVRRRLGAVVEAPAAFYPYLTGRGNLRLHGNLAGNVSDARIDEVLQMMELYQAADRKVGIYSLGMRQRLGVAAAMLTQPEVLILDEPASGMDPLSLHLVHTVLRRAAENGTAVLLSTHHLDEVVAYCTRVAILEEGALIDEVNLIDRRERYRARVTHAHQAKALLETTPFVKHVSVRGEEVVFIPNTPDDLGRVSPALAVSGIGVLEMSRDIFDLRAYYRDRVGSERARRTGALPTVGRDGGVTSTDRGSSTDGRGTRGGGRSTRGGEA
ncbi:MAG: ABC transporter ATP-binding protein [Trueperaceae bacterium]|nr:ABC transporter ATP-binding protein [Trueperaceae bacterium]